MSRAWRGKALDHIRLLSLSARTIAGRRFWIVPVLPLSTATVNDNPASPEVLAALGPGLALADAQRIAEECLA